MEVLWSCFQKSNRPDWILGRDASPRRPLFKFNSPDGSESLPARQWRVPTLDPESFPPQNCIAPMESRKNYETRTRPSVAEKARKGAGEIF